MRPPLSLKGRALALLAQREQSVVELRRKLTRHARQAARAEAPSTSLSAADVADGADVERDPVDDVPEKVEAVIAWLREHDYLSENRFVESRVHARSARFGQARIRQELAQHGLALSPDLAASLRDSEFDRAAEVWRRKFGDAPADRAAQARQTRFLIARGFSADIVRRLVRIDGRPDRVATDD